MSWMTYALMTVATWGLYGILLHSGQVKMMDPVNGRYKAFLVVGVAYFLIAVLAPLAMLKFQDANWNFTSQGVWLSLAAGIVGAVGAFCVLLSFGAGGKPWAVMSIIFAGAPIVNAAISMMLSPPKDGFKWQFIVGILLAAFGGYLVAYYKPGPGPKKVEVTQDVSVSHESKPD